MPYKQKFKTIGFFVLQMSCGNKEVCTYARLSFRSVSGHLCQNQDIILSRSVDGLASTGGIRDPLVTFSSKFLRKLHTVYLQTVILTNLPVQIRLHVYIRPVCLTSLFTLVFSLRIRTITVCYICLPGDGRRCEPEGCNVLNNCDVNAECVPDPRDTSRYMCRCNPGFEGDGTVCIRRGIKNSLDISKLQTSGVYR